MGSLRAYILSVICAAVICGILQMLVPKGTVSTLIKVITGLVVVITALSPLINEEILRWDLRFDRIVSDGSAAITAGQDAASELLRERIKEETESYILTKASAMGLTISAEVEVASDFPNAPERVTLNGHITPYRKQQLASYLSSELGIPEENQKWMS